MRYKARVEIGIVMELDIEAIHEDNAATIAEEVAMSDILFVEDPSNVKNMEVRVLEVEEEEENA